MGIIDGRTFSDNILDCDSQLSKFNDNTFDWYKIYVLAFSIKVSHCFNSAWFVSNVRIRLFSAGCFLRTIEHFNSVVLGNILGWEHHVRHEFKVRTKLGETCWVIGKKNNTVKTVVFNVRKLLVARQNANAQNFIGLDINE